MNHFDKTVTFAPDDEVSDDYINHGPPVITRSSGVRADAEEDLPDVQTTTAAQHYERGLFGTTAAEHWNEFARYWTVGQGPVD